MPRRTTYRRYNDDFKATAIKLSELDGVLSRDVAEALDIHELMLSRWKKDLREGKIMAKGKDISLEPRQVAELKRLQEVERKYKLLQEEHALLKKAIEFTLQQKKKSSNT
jgi:transposase-like protein